MELAPTFPDIYHSLGDAYSAQGKYDDAIVAYHRALQLAPANANVYLSLGNALRNAGKLDDAIMGF